MGKRTKIWIIIACSFIFLGGVVFGLTAVNQNFNFNKMFYAYNYETKTQTFALTDFEKININLQNVNVSVYASENTDFKIEYNEYENKEYKFATANNILKITISNPNWLEYLTFKLPLQNTAKIYIPLDYSGEITMQNAENITIKNATLASKIVLE